MSQARPILVLGGSGQLGSALVRQLRREGRGVDAPTRLELDLRRLDALAAAVARRTPSAVINAAAYTDVGAAEKPENRKRVFQLNRDAPGVLARACRTSGLPLIHVSTDFVFDGRKTTPYVEEDPVGPLQVYGASKLEGERRVVQEYAAALVVRTSTVFGPDRRDGSNYVAAILGQAVRGGPLSLVRPPVSSPTYSVDLAEAVLALLDAESTGLVHVANAGGCSRFELACEALKLAGLANSVELRERASPEGELERPAYSVLDTGRFSELTGRTMRPWQLGVKDYVDSWKRPTAT